LSGRGRVWSTLLASGRYQRRHSGVVRALQERRLPLGRGASSTSLPRPLPLPRCSSCFLFERSAVRSSLICRELARGYRSTGRSCTMHQAGVRPHPATGGTCPGGCPFPPCFSAVRSFLLVRLQAAVLASKSLCSDSLP
jgi:hypothetical protein